MKILSLLRQLRHLRETVRTTYGGGITAWGNYLYYGLFRINRFKILKADLSGPLTAEATPRLSFSHPALPELDEARSRRELPREFFCDRFHKVGGCCIGRFDGELAYIHWLYYRGDYSRFLNIGPESAEINYVLTLPEFRGHGISTKAMLYSLARLRKEGIKSVFAVVHEENVASIKSFIRAGFTECGDLVSFGQFNRKVPV